MSTVLDENAAVKPTSIKLEEPLWAKGKARAKERRQSFSSYVATLIEEDVARAAKGVAS